LIPIEIIVSRSPDIRRFLIRKSQVFMAVAN